MKIRPLILLALAAACRCLAFDIAPAGAEVAKRIDALDVAHHWLSGQRIDWKTGNFSSESTQHATHCSAFAAAACDLFNVYLLRPPEHGQTLLANAQQDWLETKGAALGWKPVATPEVAQHLANEGWLVLATYKSADPKKAGHVAVIRPSEKSEEDIQKEGPQETQAGRYNYVSTSVQKGFAAHPGAFEQGKLLYFAHPIELAVGAAASAKAAQ